MYSALKILSQDIPKLSAFRNFATFIIESHTSNSTNSIQIIFCLLFHVDSTLSLSKSKVKGKTKEVHIRIRLFPEIAYLRNRSALPSGRWTWPGAWCPACRGSRWSCSAEIRLHSASRTGMGCPWWGFFGHPTSWTIPRGTQFWRIVATHGTHTFLDGFFRRNRNNPISFTIKIYSFDSNFTIFVVCCLLRSEGRWWWMTKRLMVAVKTELQ